MRDSRRGGGWAATSPIKASAADTDGRFCQLEFTDPCGNAPPVHIHHWEDETFYVLEGLVSVFIGDARIDALAGDFVFMPRDVPHTYLVRSERARALVTFAPAGVEQFFIEMGLPVSDPDRPPAPVVPDHDVVRARAGALRRRDRRPAAEAGAVAMATLLHIEAVARAA